MDKQKLCRDTTVLRQKLNKALKEMKASSTSEEKFFYINYIANLYDSISKMEKEKEKVVFFESPSSVQVYRKKGNEYNRKAYKNFTFQKKHHEAYLGNIIWNIENDYSSIPNVSCTKKERTFSKNDFWDVLYEFLKKINLENYFDKILKEQDIHFLKNNRESGFAIYNPINKDIDLFINDFHYDVYHMEVLVHEFGHAYDLSQFEGNVKDYNKYFYLSFYSEVLSTLLERAYLHFLLKNNIKKEAAKAEMTHFEDNNYSILLGSYIWSILDRKLLLSRTAPQTLEEIPIKEIKPYFEENSNLKQIIQDVKNLNFLELYNYTYGDILSMFYCDEVLQNGISNDMIHSFLQERKKLFSKEFLEENKFSPKQYAKLYQKEIGLIKK